VKIFYVFTSYNSHANGNGSCPGSWLAS